MKRFLALAGAALLLACAAARAAGPDEQYVQLYDLLQEADKLADSGQTRLAVTKYLEAQTGLRSLQTTFPDWNSKIVGFRLNYISSRLEPLTQKVSTGQAGPAPAPVSPQQALTNQVRELQDDVTRLSNQNALLEARLREALTVQPASSDPRELAKAEDKIRQLQKERDLLAVSLEQFKSQPSPAPVAGMSDKEKQAVEELRRQFQGQAALIAQLRKQNEELQLQNAARPAATGAVAGSAAAEIARLKEALVMVQASNQMMQAEQVAMETRLLDWVRRYNTGAGSAPGGRERELETQLAAARSEATSTKRERDELAGKIGDLTRQLNERPAVAAAVPTNAAPDRQVETLRAKLEAFEAKAVPYTPEELALFKQPPPKEMAVETAKPAFAATTTPPAQKKPDELPAAARPLLASAERAIDAGKYAEAENKIAEALRLDDSNVYLLSRLAAAQLDQDKTAEAEANLKKSLALDPEHPATLAMMGDLKFRQEKYDEAVESLSLAAKFRPDRPDTHYMLGRALIQKGQRQPAETALRKAVQLRPSWGEPHYQLAVLYATQQPGFPELAQYHYKKSIAGGVPRNLEFEKFLEKPAAKKP